MSGIKGAPVCERSCTRDVRPRMGGGKTEVVIGTLGGQLKVSSGTKGIYFKRGHREGWGSMKPAGL